MKTAVSLVITGMLITGAAFVSAFGDTKQPTPTVTALPPTFDEQYVAQVMKANAAMRDYDNTPCNAPTDLQAKAKKLDAESEALHKLYDAIPKDEDELLQAKQLELAIGYTTLLRKVGEQKAECVAALDAMPKG